MMLSTSHQIKPWISDIPPWEKIEVDLNFDIFWGEYEGKRVDIEEFLSDTIEFDENSAIFCQPLRPASRKTCSEVRRRFAYAESRFIAASREQGSATIGKKAQIPQSFSAPASAATHPPRAITGTPWDADFSATARGVFPIAV